MMLVLIGRFAPLEGFGIQAVRDRQEGNAGQIRFIDLTVLDVDLDASAHLARPFLESRLKVGGAKPDTGKIQCVHPLCIASAIDKGSADYFKRPRSPTPFR